MNLKESTSYSLVVVATWMMDLLANSAKTKTKIQA
jgi:hypothetical protein